MIDSAADCEAKKRWECTSMIGIATTDADSSIVDEWETRAVSVSIGDPIMKPVAITRRLGD
jgi:hypothetical protein